MHRSRRAPGAGDRSPASNRQPAEAARYATCVGRRLPSDQPDGSEGGRGGSRPSAHLLRAVFEQGGWLRCLQAGKRLLCFAAAAAAAAAVAWRQHTKSPSSVSSF
eukprot:1141042-Pelagomonas_calceolata.AAC.9